jgi:hypothetical protein
MIAYFITQKLIKSPHEFYRKDQIKLDRILRMIFLIHLIIGIIIGFLTFKYL